ncbi:flagellar hook-associated protein FlgK [bacterium]|nr:flagellar hook-associated protein FlgK [bacterium]
MSLSSALNITARAMTVNQYAMNIVSNNIANMNTEGYSKQRVNLSTVTNKISIGESVERQIKADNGVQLASVTRYNNQFLKDYYRSQNSYAGYLNQSADLASQLDSIMNELSGNGLDSKINAFYEALNNLNEYPADSTARVNFIETAKSLVAKFASLSEELNATSGNAMGDGTRGSMEKSMCYVAINDLNAKLQELAEVNATLKRVQTGSLGANNLLDTRDKILNDLSEFYDFTVEENKNGTVSLSLGTMTLVEGENVVGTLEMVTAEEFYGSKEDIPEGADKAIINVVKEDGTKYKNINEQMTSGKLGALVQSDKAENGKLTASKVIEQLDILANSIGNVFNELQTREGAYCLNNTWSELEASTTPLFVGGFTETLEDGTTITTFKAADIRINSDIENKPYLIAAAYFDDPSMVDKYAIGNSDNVVAMLQTRSEKNNPGLDGQTFEEFYTALVGKVAVQTSTGDASAEAQQEVCNSIQSQITAETSVDLNEELTDLIKYQTAFAAAARVFNVCNNCFEVLVSLGS